MGLQWQRLSQNALRGNLLRQNLDFVHPAEIFVEQDVAVKHEGAGDGGVAEIHAHLDAGIGILPHPKRNFDGVAKILIAHRLSVDFQQQKVNLVDMKIMGLKGVVFYGPVFDGSYVRRDFSLGSKTLCFCPSTLT
jgi:hypothetical protein